MVQNVVFIGERAYEFERNVYFVLAECSIL